MQEKTILLKNLARYRSENNFVRPSKLHRKLKHDEPRCKKFWYSNSLNIIILIVHYFQICI